MVSDPVTDSAMLAGKVVVAEVDPEGAEGGVLGLAQVEAGKAIEDAEVKAILKQLNSITSAPIQQLQTMAYDLAAPRASTKPQSQS